MKKLNGLFVLILLLTQFTAGMCKTHKDLQNEENSHALSGVPAQNSTSTKRGWRLPSLSTTLKGILVVGTFSWMIAQATAFPTDHACTNNPRWDAYYTICENAQIALTTTECEGTPMVTHQILAHYVENCLTSLGQATRENCETIVRALLSEASRIDFQGGFKEIHDHFGRRIEGSPDHCKRICHGLVECVIQFFFR